MKARIKSNGKIVEVISRFMPRKRNAASRDWVCNLSDGTCIDESQLEYIEESIGVLEEAADNHIRKVADTAGHPGWDWTTQDIADAFIAGAKWQKEQMMKEAVEGEVMDFCFAREVNYSSAKIKFSAIPELKVGDKVRIIIIKEDK